MDDLVTVGDIAARITKPNGDPYTRQWMWALSRRPGFPEPVKELPAVQGRPRPTRLWAWADVERWFKQEHGQVDT